VIEQFSRDDFENYLTQNHSPFQCLGLVQGEEAYLLPLDSQVSIMVRSSVKRSGVSAGTGKDSIRVWLQNGSKPLGSKISKWTTRQPNWQSRLSKNIKQLILWRSLSGDCKECGHPKGIFIARTEKNNGRPFTRCHNGFVWLDEPIQVKDIYFSEASKGDDSENTKPETPRESSGDSSELEILAQDKPKQKSNDLRDWAAVGESYDTDEYDAAGIVSNVPEDKTPNEAQREAIETDIDVNVRVLAGPGSGKTFVIERRYKYLVDSGVKPNKILVCTFNKHMATEMTSRIKETCQEANIEQISTIHAFCSRLLTKWDTSSKYYGWKVPKDWQVKSQLESLIEKNWYGELPSAKEVFEQINLSKAQGLRLEESHQWFIVRLGDQNGNRLHKIRDAKSLPDLCRYALFGGAKIEIRSGVAHWVTK
jgi:hypothetical protein